MPERILVEVKGKAPGEIARDLNKRIPHVFLLERINTTLWVLTGVLFGQLVCVLGQQAGGLQATTTVKVLLAMMIFLTGFTWLLQRAAVRRMDPHAPPEPADEDDEEP